jgi:hypothetical protein
VFRDFGQDLRFGARSLRRSAGFSGLVVFTLALGISANTAIFSLLDTVLLRPLPVSDPDRLVQLSDGSFEGVAEDSVNPGRIDALSTPLYQRLRQEASLNETFEGIAVQQANRTQMGGRRQGGDRRDRRRAPGQRQLFRRGRCAGLAGPDLRTAGRDGPGGQPGGGAQSRVLAAPLRR